MSRKQLCRAAVIWALSIAPVVSAAVICGGPIYDSSTGTGYLNPYLRGGVGSCAGSGIGVGCAAKGLGDSSEGPLAVRWDASGAASELGNLGTDSGGHTVSEAHAINAAGIAVGWADKYVAGSNKGTRAVRWDTSGMAMELETLGTDSSGFGISSAHAINSTGTAAGVAWKHAAGNDLGFRAVRWDASGAATELKNLGTDSDGHTANYAIAINDAGTVVGSAVKYVAGSFKGERAVRWDASDTATELGSLGADGSGVASSYATAINSAGTAVGRADKYVLGASKGSRAVRWDLSGTATELENLGTDNDGHTASEAVAINDAGTTVGYAGKYVAGSYKGERAVRWDAIGTEATELTGLGTDSGGWTGSAAHAINDAGLAVGSADKYDAFGNPLGSRAAMWGLDGAAIDLSTLIGPASGWLHLSYAADISDDNWITGVGLFDPDGAGPLAAYDRLFLLQVPEPGAAGLLISGALLLLKCRRH